MPENHSCPCGSEKNYNRCCRPLLAGETKATTTEQLMRSRYSAYVLCMEQYLLQTWHASTRPQTLDLQIEPVKWLGLKIISTQAGQEGDTEGVVEFIARYKLNGKAHLLHENSRFVKEQGEWFYVDGDVIT